MNVCDHLPDCKAYAVSQHSADDASILVVKVALTHSAPGVVIQKLHAPSGKVLRGLGVRARQAHVQHCGHCEKRV